MKSFPIYTNWITLSLCPHPEAHTPVPLHPRPLGNGTPVSLSLPLVTTPSALLLLSVLIGNGNGKIMGVLWDLRRDDSAYHCPTIVLFCPRREPHCSSFVSTLTPSFVTNNEIFCFWDGKIPYCCLTQWTRRNANSSFV